MTDTQVNAVHIINRYVFDILRDNVGIARADYGGKTPIIPSQQVPEINQYNKPFLVYGFSEAATGEIYFVRDGTVAYAVYAVEDRDIVKILNVLTEVFSRQDDAARDLNNYKGANSAFKDTIFMYLNVAMVEGPSPADMEGGRQSGIITINYCYRNNYSVNTLPALT